MRESLLDTRVSKSLAGPALTFFHALLLQLCGGSLRLLSNSPCIRRWEASRPASIQLDGIDGNTGCRSSRNAIIISVVTLDWSLKVSRQATRWFFYFYTTPESSKCTSIDQCGCFAYSR